VVPVAAPSSQVSPVTLKPSPQSGVQLLDPAELMKPVDHEVQLAAPSAEKVFAKQVSQLS
jgi:hypothetical protein